MKKKPLLITILCLVVAFIAIFLVLRARNSRKVNTFQIAQFIAKFNYDLQAGNIDSLRNYFADSHNLKIKQLINALANKTNLDSKDSAEFKTTFDSDKLEVLSGTNNVAVVRVPLTFSHDYIASQTSYITFTVRKFGENQYKFVKVKADVFAKNYMAYKEKIDESFPNRKPVEYDPITLAAFKTAETLKGRYDSVVWFQHIGGQDYFYVVNGSLDRINIEQQLDKDSAKTYKMGLLSPDLKEIVPVQYDLIHNINGTFKGMVEVDKDQKHGFYTLDGKLAVPVEYDQVFPVNDDTHLAAMRKGNDYYWLNKDLSISGKENIKISDILTQVKNNLQFDLAPPQTDIMEWNSHEDHSSIYIAPSYLVDLNIMPKMEMFKNSLRKNTEDNDDDNETTAYNVDLDHTTTVGNSTNAFETLFYDIKDHFIGGRVDLYEKKNLIVIDKQNNRLLSHDIDISGDEGEVPTVCNDYSFKLLNDSLFEVKVSASIYIGIPTDTIISETLSEGPVYHYFKIADNKLVELDTKRTFSFTKFVKMDDSYLKGCYSYFTYNQNHPDRDRKQLQTDYLKPKFYQYIVNEIYADYNYKFTNQKWIDCFQDYGGVQSYKPENVSVNDSLTPIGKYNITWLRQKMAKPVLKTNRLAMQ